MKNDKGSNYRRQNIDISKRNIRTNNFTSPKKEKITQKNETPKKNEDIPGNTMLENTLKYLEMSNEQLYYKF